MIFDYNKEKYAKGLSLLDMLKADDILSKTPKMYIPTIETYENGVMFMSNGTTVFIKETGPIKVRFILLDKNGRILTDPESSFTQLNLKQAKYLVRFSCPSMGMSGPNLSMDYLVDIHTIKFDSDSVMHAKEKVGSNHSKVTEIIEDYQYRFVSEDMSGINDPLIAQFDANRDEILNRYFK